METPHFKLSVKFIFYPFITLILSILLYPSCENDVKTITLLSNLDTLPLESVRDIEVVQSENGKLSFILTSPQLDRYETQDPYMEFPIGLKVVFYDSLGKIRSELTANYGISYEKRNIMEAKGNVVVINHLKNEKLNTEQLVWDRAKKTIYSDVFVKITTKDKIIYGENGLEADEQFESWRLKKVKGDIIIPEDEF